MAVPPYVTTGTTITSTWGNQVADAVVNVFASSAARSSAITSPGAGQVSALTTNLATEGLEVYNSAGQWRKPWNLPWGYAPISAVPGSFSFSSSVGTSSNFTWTSVDNRYYMVTLTAELAYDADVATSVDTVHVETSGASDISNPVLRHRPPDNVAGQWALSGSFVWEATSSGTQTWRLSAVGTADTATRQCIAYGITIVDVGPAGAPV